MSSQTLILSQQDVQQLLNLKTCIELQETAFRWYGQGKSMNAPNSWLDLPSYHGWMKLMGGVNESEDRFAAKITARFPQLPLGNNLQGIIVLFNAQDGTILSIMDGITSVPSGRVPAGDWRPDIWLVRIPKSWGFWALVFRPDSMWPPSS